MYLIFKRIFDILVALLMLPVIIIIVVIIVPFVFLDDKGPLFYNAPRVGKNYKIFKMYKLRTMKVDAPDLRNSDGSTFNSENDPRVTKIGKFLRKTSLDEFPQFINVLKGDMSLVGPRPILPVKEYSEFKEELEKSMKIRPGITGYNQAYFRNSITRKEKYKNDAFYADKMNLILDLKIIYKTFCTVILRKNINTNN
jgi:lipopolysaccharide/colanic/teichoic acid biosynthesis glycosyltransferase